MRARRQRWQRQLKVLLARIQRRRHLPAARRPQPNEMPSLPFSPGGPLGSAVLSARLLPTTDTCLLPCMPSIGPHAHGQTHASIIELSGCAPPIQPMMCLASKCTVPASPSVPAVPTHTALRRNNPMRQRPIPEICIRQEIGFVFSPSQSAAAGIPRGPGSGVDRWEYFGSMQRRRSTRSRSDARKPAAVQERQSSRGFIGHSRDRRGGQVEHGCRSLPAGL